MGNDGWRIRRAAGMAWHNTMTEILPIDTIELFYDTCNLSAKLNLLSCSLFHCMNSLQRCARSFVHPRPVRCPYFVLRACRPPASVGSSVHISATFLLSGYCRDSMCSVFSSSFFCAIITSLLTYLHTTTTHLCIAARITSQHITPCLFTFFRTLSTILFCFLFCFFF